MAGTPGIRPPASVHERLLDEATDYFQYAKEFGWTSAQVDNEPAWLLDRYPIIFGALTEARDMLAQRQAAAQRAAEHARR